MDTCQYADTSQYVNTVEYCDTREYDRTMQDRLTRQDRKSQTRERLIDAAARVFARRGFEAATIDEVAAAAGFTKGAVYSNFASKTELFVALIERRIELQSADHRRRLEAIGPPGAAGDSGPRDDVEPDWDMQWIVLAVEFWLHAMRNPRAREALAEQYRRARTISASLIAAAYDKVGEKPLLPPREMAIVVEALGIGLAFQALLDPKDVTTSLQGQVLTEILKLPGFGGPAPERGTSG